MTPNIKCEMVLMLYRRPRSKGPYNKSTIIKHFPPNSRVRAKQVWNNLANEPYIQVSNGEYNIDWNNKHLAKQFLMNSCGLHKDRVESYDCDDG